MSYRRAGADTGDMSKDTLFAGDVPEAPPKRTGLCAPCKWAKEDIFNRWTFFVMLLFGVLTPVWLILRTLGSSLTGDILSGLGALILACYAANHFRILLGLKEQVDRFAKSNREFKRENEMLNIEVNKLKNAVEELTGVSHRLQQTTRSYEDNIGKFKALDERLGKLADDNIAGLEKLQEMSKTVQDSIQKELVQHERDILMKVQESMEFGDDKDGLSKQEYNRFIKALPKTFQRRFNNMGQTFEQIAGDDGVLDMDEFTKLADHFAVEEAESKCDHK